MAIRILLNDPEAITRSTLLDHIENAAPDAIVYTVSEEQSIPEHSHFHLTDVLVTETQLPDTDGYDLIRKINVEHPGIRMLVYTSRTSRMSVREAFEAGASGYLLKHRDEPEIITAVHAILSGKRYISPHLSRGMTPDEFLRNCELSRLDKMFTRREIDILECIREALPNRKIAEKLNISVETVRTHKRIIREKTGLHSSAEITKFLIENEMF